MSNGRQQTTCLSHPSFQPPRHPARRPFDAASGPKRRFRSEAPPQVRSAASGPKRRFSSEAPLQVRRGGEPELPPPAGSRGCDRGGGHLKGEARRRRRRRHDHARRPCRGRVPPPRQRPRRRDRARGAAGRGGRVEVAAGIAVERREAAAHPAHGQHTVAGAGDRLAQPDGCRVCHRAPQRNALGSNQIERPRGCHNLRYAGHKP